MLWNIKKVTIFFFFCNSEKEVRIVRYKLATLTFIYCIVEFCFVFFHHGIKNKKVIVTFYLTILTNFLAIASLYPQILTFNLTVLIYISQFGGKVMPTL